MNSLPKVIVSSVVRSSVQGESHGGVYIVDLENQSWEQKIDWNDPDISWEGRGWDRGLRGIAFYNNNIYLAASDELFVYDCNFQLINSYRNRYLKHCHEIFVDRDVLYLTSTGYDSILLFELQAEKFIQGLKVTTTIDSAQIDIFNPMDSSGPGPSRNCHLNNVYVSEDRIYVCGTKLNRLLAISNYEVEVYAALPYVSHNARPFENGVLFADTGSDQISIMDCNERYLETFPVIKYSETEMSWTHLSNDRARQGFVRGLCVTNDGHIVAGSSPSTVAVYERGNQSPVTTVKITSDIRNSVHGLELWPF